jgi:REP element-mobilizing transposase RayT
MARPIRVEVAGGLYHVIVRGNERRAVFRDDADRAKYLQRLAHYREKLSFQLLAYCLLDNHVHLAIETGKPPLSKVMAGLQSSYTQYFNRGHDRAGHLFQGRYKAFLVEEDPYALALIRYIHENPVKAHIVERPDQYVWSSDRYYRRGRGPEWLDLDRVLRMLGSRRSASVREYRRLMREPVEESYEDVPSWAQSVKGDEAFADRILQAIGEPRVVPRGLTVERIAQQVARSEGVTLTDMRGASRGRNESRARLLTAWVCREVAKISAARVAKYFCRDTSTLTQGLGRLEAEMASNQALRRRASRLEESLRSR